MIPDPPPWRSQQRVLLTGGFVYTPADPFATSMLVAGHEVAWVGSEGAALAMADGVDRVVELDGALVTPAFVDAHASAADSSVPVLIADRAAAGVGLIQVADGGEPDSGGPWSDAADGDATPGPIVLELSPGDPAGAPGPARLGAAIELDGPVAGLADRVRELAGQGLLACLQVRSSSHVRRALEVLEAAGDRAGAARIDLAAAPTDDELEQIAHSRVAVCVFAQGRAGIHGLPLATMAAAGVPLTVGGGTPWDTIAAAVNHPDDQQRISARAAFLAHTRGGWRAAGMPGQGVLVPGAAAHYAVWQVEDLVVQAPDDRIQAWSTDPRSGTPGLPDLAPEAPRPQLLDLAVWGASVPIST